MTSTHRAALRSLLAGAVVVLAVTAGPVPAGAAPVPGSAGSLDGATSAVAGAPGATGNLTAARAEAQRLRTEIDALAKRARQAADDAERDERRYAELSVQATEARRQYEAARRHADDLAQLGTDRVRALYMSGGELGAVNTLLRAQGLGALASARENVTVIVADDTEHTAAAAVAADAAAAAKARVEKLVEGQAAAAAAAGRTIATMAASLRTRRDLLQQADSTVQALVAEQAAQAASLAQARAAEAQARTATTDLTGDLPPVTGDWTRPVVGPISSGFGPRWGTFHAGLDFAARPGSVIRAASSGTVTLSRWYGGYGNAVEIDHGGNLHTRYGHAAELLVTVGEYVEVGQPIALVGSTGDSTGPHLHFEVRVNGAAIDPAPFLTARGITL
jgi:murein DD-endopeptidase MepM/ murein hydrolase activator NlpD